MEGGKALRHQVFMYMDCKCQHVCGPCNIIAMFYKSCKVFPVFPPLEANKTYLIVYRLVYFTLLCYIWYYAVLMLLEWLVWSTKQKDWDSAMIQDFLNSIMTHR